MIKLKKNDWILIAGILIIALVAILCMTWNKKEGGEVIVTVDKKIYKTLPLSEDATLLIGEKTADYNILEIKDGKVRMKEANCPDKICVEHRAIHYDHESIICLPHKVTVEIRGGEDSDVDVMVH
ncbi:NusG domain II-containing protein [Novisyntrophococcus fermenticellae]|uniref:NusG domain II-containing protein n=1 Tax=Novisyntrophococcus fermenticellae TaxID=2068655 RepID=UPI001E60DD4E|nr:NusG domain II-containing protein [Novisyntrophococcus fermenticellae]